MSDYNCDDDSRQGNGTMQYGSDDVPNINWDDDDSGGMVNPNAPGSNGGQPNPQDGLNMGNLNPEEVEPVVMSKKKVGAIVICFLFVLIIFCYVLKGCSITRQVRNSSDSSDVGNSPATTEVFIGSNSVDASSEFYENDAENLSAESALPEETSTAELTESVKREVIVNKNPVQDNVESVESDNSGNDVAPQQGMTSSSLVEVADAVLSEPITTTGIVSGKSTFLIENSYLYRVRMIVIVGEGQNTFCDYYCPRKTWDALSTGDSLTVDYQLDNRGNISIVSISK